MIPILIRRISRVSLLAIAIWLVSMAGSPAVFAAPGDLLGTVDIVGNGSQSVGGTFDGTYYIAPLSGGGWGSDTLRIYEPPVGGNGNAVLEASKSVKDVAGAPVTVSGVAWDPNRGMVWGAHNHTIWVIDIGDPTVDGDALAVFQFNSAVGGDSIVDGLAYDGDDDTLYYSPDQNCCVYQFSLGIDFNAANPALGTLMNTVAPKNSAGEEDGNVSGVVIGSNNTLYISRPQFNEIRRVDKTTGDFIAQFAALSPDAWVEDLTCDPVTYAPNEAILAKYAFNSLYEAFEVEAGTCPLAVERVDLSIAKTDSPDPVIAGKQLTYAIMVTNNSDVTATGVMVVDSLPGGVTVESTSPGCTDSGDTVTCDVGEIEPQATADLTVVVTVEPETAGPLSNTATVEGSQFDPDLGNNSATAETTVKAAATPSPSGRVYEVTVFPSFGGRFQDCFRFESDGSLTVDLLGTGPWEENFLGEHFAWWLGVAGPNPSFFVRFGGVTFHDDGTRLRAYGRSNDEQLPDRFRVRGSENPACSVGLEALGATWSQ